MKRIFSVVAALSASSFIYVFYRSEKTVVNKLVALALSADHYLAARNCVIESMPLKGQIIYSLPGGLWVYCVTILSRDFYLEVLDCKIQLAIFPVLFAVGLEFCQLFHVTHGTFDIWDIASYVFFTSLGLYSFKSGRSQQNILSPFTLHGFMCVACFALVYLAHVSR